MNLLRNFGQYGQTGPPGRRPIENQYAIHSYETENECIHFIKKILSEAHYRNQLNHYDLCLTIKYHYSVEEVYESINLLLNSVDYVLDDLQYLVTYAFVFDSTKITKLILECVWDKYPYRINIFVGSILVDTCLMSNMYNTIYLLDEKQKLCEADDEYINTTEDETDDTIFGLCGDPKSLYDSNIFYSIRPTLLAIENIYYFHLLDDTIVDSLGMDYRNFEHNSDLLSHICPDHFRLVILVALESYQKNRMVDLELLPERDYLWTNNILDLINPIYLINRFMRKKNWRKITLMMELGKMNMIVDVFVNHVMYHYFYRKLHPSRIGYINKIEI